MVLFEFSLECWSPENVFQVVGGDSRVAILNKLGGPRINVDLVKRVPLLELDEGILLLIKIVVLDLDVS